MQVFISTQHPGEVQHMVAHALGIDAHDVVVDVPAHGRRLRRQGNADVAVRVRRRRSRAQHRPRGQAAARSRRRHALDRQAPRVRLLATTSASTTTAASSGSTSRSRRAAASPPTCPGRSTIARCSTPTTPTGCPTSRSIRYRCKTQHGLGHRVPRLRRTAGHVRDRARDRRDRARTAPRPARRAQREFYGTTTRNVTPYGMTIEDNIAPALVARLETHVALPRATRGDRRVESRQSGDQARHRADAGEVRHLVHRDALQPGRRAGPPVPRRHACS